MRNRFCSATALIAKGYIKLSNTINCYYCFRLIYRIRNSFDFSIYFHYLFSNKFIEMINPFLEKISWKKHYSKK